MKSPQFPSKSNGARYRLGVTVEQSTDRTKIARGNTSARKLPTVLGLQLRHRIGAGGEGEVWAAAAADGAVRALKLIRPDVLADPVTFAQRAQDLARIDDPALVRVYRAKALTVGEWAGWGAMVMDLIDGESLDDARLGAAAFGELVPLAGALDRLHAGEWSQGYALVHRDVKPSNLIRTPRDGIVLVDPSSLRSVGGDMTYVGTPLFVAPEVVTGRFGPGADVYSFAATLVALHSGARGDELAGLLADPWSLDVPEPVIRALSLEPAERPARCIELVDPAAGAVTVIGSSPLSGDARGAEPSERPQTRRTWWRLGLLTAAALAVAVGLIVPLPLLALAGIGAAAGLLAIDPALRDRSLVWLPLSCARWLVRTLETDDEERDRVAATVHGALLVPLLPIAGVAAGLGPSMVVFGTVGQIAGVGVILAMAIVWVTIATSGRAESSLSPIRVLLFLPWVVGMFAAALTRVVFAIIDAVSAPAVTLPDGPPSALPEESSDEPPNQSDGDDHRRKGGRGRRA